MKILAFMLFIFCQMNNRIEKLLFYRSGTRVVIFMILCELYFIQTTPSIQISSSVNKQATTALARHKDAVIYILHLIWLNPPNMLNSQLSSLLSSTQSPHARLRKPNTS